MSDLTVFTPGPCCDYPNQYATDNGESIYLITCDCVCHDADNT
ncbi:hypothetical protein OG393_21080 [Streptomyces sp. NBC_01216]|nr:hypothetical protein OG393_21080 [Streptomyces sp. NBC_01216]